MKLKLEINNISKRPIDKKFLLAVVKSSLAKLEFEFLADKEIQISIAIVPYDEMKALNKQYRNLNKTTDILSFAEYKNIRELENESKKVDKKQLFLGELVLCYDDIKEYAKQEKLELEMELAKVVSHGVLHLVGFVHGKKMYSLQQSVAENFKQK